MKLKLNLLAGAAILSAVSLTSLAQTPAIPDGSNGSRAPLPANRPSDYSAATTQNADSSALVANHIGAPESNQAFAITPVAPLPESYATTAPAAEPVLSPTGRSVAIAGESLGAANLSSQIRSNATASQDQLRDVEARVAVSEQSMATTRSAMPTLSTEGQEKFDAANSEVKAKGQSLRRSIKAARNTSSEQVAADFEAYAAAVTRVDALASGQP
ncbi:MAG: hypothetical protein Q7S40_13925 [Opitutaceae bacterium]|nr:hypothetical protein [Opitutaceae bacterium]